MTKDVGGRREVDGCLCERVEKRGGVEWRRGTREREKGENEESCLDVGYDWEAAGFGGDKAEVFA